MMHKIKVGNIGILFSSKALARRVMLEYRIPSLKGKSVLILGNLSFCQIFNIISGSDCYGVFSVPGSAWHMDT